MFGNPCRKHGSGYKGRLKESLILTRSLNPTDDDHNLLPPLFRVGVLPQFTSTGNYL
jgi:hypothetical protein